MNHEQIELAIEAFEIVGQRHQQIDAQWRMRLERAEYESQLAQRRYEQVDPSNRLVASTLEQRWNDALIELHDVQEQIAELAREFTDEEIAEQINATGLVSRKGNRFTRSSISWVRHKHGIECVDKRELGEVTVKELAERLGVKPEVVYSWIASKTVVARRLNAGSPYLIAITPKKQEEPLRKATK